MWSPNELLKTEKQRDILSYITLQFFPFKKVPLEHYPKSGQPFVKGSTAQFGKKSQTGFLPQFKVWKAKEYCMYFSFFKLKKWDKKTAETRRRKCAVLP